MFSWLGECRGMCTDHTVHVSFGPDDVMIVADDHRPTENMEVLHDIFLDIRQSGDMRVIT